MKKTILIIVIAIISCSVFGQITKPDTTKKEFKNSIEVDITSLLHQFFYSGQGFYGSSPYYIISYKRFFKSNALRFGVGGDISDDNSTKNDTIDSKYSRYSFNVGLGIEHYFYLSKRWNFFFGIDATASYLENVHVQGNSTTSSYKSNDFQYGFGVSPLIGIQFNINRRLSLSTETSYNISYTYGIDKRTQTPPSSYDYETKSHGLQSTFYAPLGIKIRLHF
jgi:hypothetical protein